MRLLVVGLGLLLAGCTTVWTRPGLTEAEFRTDDYACRHDAAMLPSPPNSSSPNVTSPGWTGTYQAGTALSNESQGWFHLDQQARMYRMCMEARGYTKQ